MFMASFQFLQWVLKCVVPSEVSILPPWRAIGKGEGGLKGQTFRKKSMKPNWNFLGGVGGGGVETKKPSMRGVMDIFWIYTILKSLTTTVRIEIDLYHAPAILSPQRIESFVSASLNLFSSFSL